MKSSANSITVGKWYYVDECRKVRAEVTVRVGGRVKDDVRGTVLLAGDPISGEFRTWGDCLTCWLSADLVDLVLNGSITAKEISAVVEESANRWETGHDMREGD